MRTDGKALFALVLCSIFISLNGAEASASDSWDGFNKSKYKDVQAFMRAIVQKYPQNAELITVGTNDAGQPIEGLKLGNGSVHNLVVATHHGNEYGSTEVAKAVAASVAESPLLGQTLYVVPVLNIGGYDARRRWEIVKGDSYDPNRDYPNPCGSEGPFNLKSTAAIAKLLEDKEIVASATLHSFTPAVLYPWGMSATGLSTHYDDLFVMLGQAATVESKYAVGNSAELVYGANGTFEDYAYVKHGIWSLLFELGFSHSPNEAAVKELVRVNVPGIRRMMEQAPRQRAEKHEFEGRCDARLRMFDRHDE